MGKIYTKSILLGKERKDGIRVCVMRRIKPEFDFDIWIPKLAPPEPLLQQYVINQDITWKEFYQKYTKQVLMRNKRLIRWLVLLSKFDNVTLLCWEDSPNRCHRILLQKECLKVRRVEISSKSDDVS